MVSPRILWCSRTLLNLTLGKWLFASRKTKINPVADPEGGEKIKIKIKINEIWTKVFYHLTQETNASKLGIARLEYHVS